MAAEFQNQFHEAMREAEVADLKKEVDEMTAKATDFAHFDPLGDVAKDIEKSVGDLPPLDVPPSAEAAPAAVPSPPAELVAEALPNPPAEPAAASAQAAREPAIAAEHAATPIAEPTEAAVAKPDAGRAPA